MNNNEEELKTGSKNEDRTVGMKTEGLGLKIVWYD